MYRIPPELPYGLFSSLFVSTIMTTLNRKTEAVSINPQFSVVFVFVFIFFLFYAELELALLIVNLLITFFPMVKRGDHSNENKNKIIMRTRAYHSL